MEYDKINNLLGSESENLSKFVTRLYGKVNSLSNAYNENKSIRFKILCEDQTYVIILMRIY